jgi:ubiquitin-like protein Nedd8
VYPLLQIAVITIKVTVDGVDKKSISVSSEAVVATVKEIVKTFAGAKVSMPLLFNGEPLKDDLTLAESGVTGGAELYSTRPLKLTIKTATGKEINIELAGTCTVQDLKKSIEAIEGASPDMQTLSFDGKELLEDAATLAECNIVSGSELFLVVRLRGGGGRAPPNAVGQPPRGESREADVLCFIGG